MPAVNWPSSVRLSKPTIPILTGILTDWTVETQCAIYRTFLEPGPVVETPGAGPAEGRNPSDTGERNVLLLLLLLVLRCCNEAPMEAALVTRVLPRQRSIEPRACRRREKKKPGHKKHLLSCPQIICRSGGTERLDFSNSNMTWGALQWGCRKSRFRLLTFGFLFGS